MGLGPRGDWSCHVWADGTGWLLGPNGEDIELDPYIHAILFIKAMKLGTESRDAEIIDLREYKRSRERRREVRP